MGRLLCILTATLMVVAACGDDEPAVTDGVPQACLTALDLADDGLELAADGMAAAADGFFAASEFNVAGIEQAGDDMDDVGAQAQDLTPRYHEARDECRGAGQ